IRRRWGEVCVTPSSARQRRQQRYLVAVTHPRVQFHLTEVQGGERTRRQVSSARDGLSDAREYVAHRRRWRNGKGRRLAPCQFCVAREEPYRDVRHDPIIVPTPGPARSSPAWLSDS